MSPSGSSGSGTTDLKKGERDDVLRGLAASAASSVGTIDGGSNDDDMPTDRQSALAADDNMFEHAENVHLLARLVADLPERQQEIIRLRFFEEKSQSEIAEQVGVSQMHVSRLLKRSFEQMRDVMTAEQENLRDADDRDL